MSNLTPHQAVVLSHLTKPNHAYAVAQEINAAGFHVIGVETCYRSVASLARAEYIGVIPDTSPPAYQITPKGHEALQDYIDLLINTANYISHKWLEAYDDSTRNR